MTFAPAARRVVLIQWIALVLLLLAAGYFRFTGLMWGDYQYPHPDERFLIWVVADIAPVDSLAEYFDTAASTLNPINRGHTFYVYGDFPVILTRYAAESFFEQVGWQEILQMGRGLSALLDLGTVLLVYLAARRLAGWKVATLAGLFSGAAVLQIQQAHFFTSDSFAVFFTMLALYLAVLLVSEPDEAPYGRLMRLGLFFGAAVGLAMACKINTALVALVLPAALLLRLLRRPASEQDAVLIRMIGLAVASGALALLVFRLAMPYAFSGPGFFGLIPDAKWVANLKELAGQSAGDVDFPPALQWARRSHLFSFQNLMLWGLGLPLGCAAWLGFFVFLARLGKLLSQKEPAGPDLPEADGRPAAAARAPFFSRLDGATGGLLILWGWTGAYFLWQSLSWNATMRYQLPIYPTLALLAAWGLGSLWSRPPGRPETRRRWQVGVGAAGALVLVLTLGWAYAFTNMYNRPETRVAASHWIFANVPGPVNLEGTLASPGAEADSAASSAAGGSSYRQLLSQSGGAMVQPGKAYRAPFNAVQSGSVSSVALPALTVLAPDGGALTLRARIFAPDRPEVDLAAGVTTLLPGAVESLDLPLNGSTALQAGARYTLALEIDDSPAAAGADTSAADAEANGSVQTVVRLNGALSLKMYARVQSLEFSSGAGGMTTLSLPEGGTLRQVRLADGAEIAGPASMLTIIAQDPASGAQQMAIASPLPNSAEPILQLQPPLTLEAGAETMLAVSSAIPGQPLGEDQRFRLDFLDDPAVQYLPETVTLARPDDPLWLTFNASQSAQLDRVTLGYAVNTEAAGSSRVTLSLYDSSDPATPLRTISAELEPAPADEPRGRSLTFTLDPPAALAQGVVYNLSLAPEAGALAVRGSAPANESTWDMGLPFRMDGYDPYGGIYRADLNFEMYWDDNADKYQRFINTLDQADYLFFSSNRQWGTTTRVPERYPLTTRFYSDLLGCPAGMDVQECYNVAEVGTFAGRLGFDLVRVETSYPNIGPLKFNTQFAEEAFTVYDHPKVMIFQKRADYDSGAARALLGAVDLENVMHLTPRKAADWKNLLLSAQAWLTQQAGGTWAALFPPEGLLNRAPWLAAVVYYLFLFGLGALTYPLVRLALPGLPDRAYPLARTAGVVLFAYLAWISGSLNVPVTRALLLGILALLALAGAALGFAQRESLAAEWRARRGYFLAVEAAALVLFLLAIAIRLGNPDLWHPIYGGEKPMDFSYFNAVLKSTVFPPYDPWFAGGYINYYYYGFVLVGMPIKLLGIQPSVGYNLVMSGIFMLVGLGALSAGTNLYMAGMRKESAEAVELPASQGARRIAPAAFWAGVIAAVLLLIFGNLGTLRMYWQGLQKLAIPEQQMADASLFNRLGWAAQGAGKLISGEATALPYYPGDWYWKPSRAIQPESGNEITEFPMFTFIYADLHAHFMALPVTLLVIGWALGVLLGRGRWGTGGRWGSNRKMRALSFGLALLLGALSTGLLRPANTWDQYTYLTLAALALFYSAFANPPELEALEQGRIAWVLRNRWLRSLAPVALLVGLAVLLYRPFDASFQQGYNSLEFWKGATTNISSYLVHWGLFLFIIAAWLFDETVDWMASTPLSALNRLRPYRGALLAAGVAVLVGIIGLAVTGVRVALIAGPLGVWVTLLLLRPGQNRAKQAVLFMIGTALILTLAVELVAVKGDIGRMNTVFKFYYQAWTLLALSAAAGLAWLWGRLDGWRPGWRTAWLVGLGVLAFGAGLFPLHAARAKITDRMVNSAPHTLDGMVYMNYATYTDGLTAETSAEMDLSEDYRAIRWVQANVPGSPVIVEANTPEYRHWGTRFTIYTGLPGVIGWNWHQRQQRTVTPDTWVYDRIADVEDFYTTTSAERAADFLARYNVQYIILGQIERIWYAGPGLDKFAQFSGVLWDPVYQEGRIVIYKVR